MDDGHKKIAAFGELSRIRTDVGVPVADGSVEIDTETAKYRKAGIISVRGGMMWIVPMLAAWMSISCSAETGSKDAKRNFEKEWQALIRAEKIDEARAVCEGWLKAETKNLPLAEAHKCLANVVLSTA